MIEKIYSIEQKDILWLYDVQRAQRTVYYMGNVFCDTFTIQIALQFMNQFDLHSTIG